MVVRRGLRAILLSRVDTRLGHRLVRCWGRQVSLCSRFRLVLDWHRCIGGLHGVLVVVPCIWIRVLIAQVALTGYRLSPPGSLPTICLMACLSNLNHLELRSRSYLGLETKRAYSSSTKLCQVSQVLEMLVQSPRWVLNVFEVYHVKQR